MLLVGPHRPSQAEVGHQSVPTRRQQNVFWLDVAMNYVLRVSVFQGTRNLTGNAERLVY
jgi:hypothetical protein